MHFGPDGKLYVSVGDQQDTGIPQKLDNPFGKILRINSDGTIPTDNPFYNTTTGINRAIWAYGLRNPYTTAFDPATGKFFINDVGQDTWEEIDEGAAVEILAGRRPKATSRKSQIIRTLPNRSIPTRTTTARRLPAAHFTILRSINSRASTKASTSSPISAPAKFGF